MDKEYSSFDELVDATMAAKQAEQTPIPSVKPVLDTSWPDDDIVTPKQTQISQQVFQINEDGTRWNPVTQDFDQVIPDPRKHNPLPVDTTAYGRLRRTPVRFTYEQILTILHLKELQYEPDEIAIYLQTQGGAPDVTTDAVRQRIKIGLGKRKIKAKPRAISYEEANGWRNDDAA